MTTGADVQATFVATLVDEWVRAGVTDAVVAPGSRSTPILDALARDGRVRLHVVLDERSAGFMALGLGLATGRPAPVVTTSGTAAVELHPAVVEAHQAGVPLLAVTADRPSELHDVGAPQTIKQAGLYGSVLRGSADPGVPDLAAAGSWRAIGARSVADTVAHPSGPGPVHLNLQLREPLIGTPTQLPPGRPAGAPWHRVAAGGAQPSAEVVALLSGGAGRRGLIVAGQGAPDRGLLLAVAERLGWPVLAEPRSGARVSHPLVIGCADSLLRVPSVAALTPEIVLRVGRPWASKVVTQWLAHLDPTTAQVLVDPAGGWVDPERQVALLDRGDPDALCRDLLTSAPPTPAAPGWTQRWQQLEAAAQGAVDEQLAAEPGVTEAGVARALVAGLPADAALVTSSSMPVRDVEWWSAPRHGVTVMANRGANGIDGVLSTAVGVASGHRGPTAALVGDLAFLYDAGSLLGLTERDIPLTVVVVDNRGGGIFSFLPQATALPAERFERLWATPHDLDLVAVAGAYGLPARRLESIDALTEAIRAPATGASVLVLSTQRDANVEAHDRLNAAVHAAVDRLG
jgi:2-succinyl-5-enolpyruvyl-6-hydroxy-3-cyclohexene-1-carboxylate synthase